MVKVQGWVLHVQIPNVWEPNDVASLFNYIKMGPTKTTPFLNLETTIWKVIQITEMTNSLKVELIQ